RLFAEHMKPEQTEFGFDVTGITDEKFWEKAEANIYATLESYAERANGHGYQRRLFAGDAARGFAFIDICRKRFDVVLMNPPFGDCSRQAKLSFEQQYPLTKNDIYAAFVECGLKRLQIGGMLGAITSRSGFFLSSFEKWRETVLL